MIFLPKESLYWIFDYPSMIEREHPYRFAKDEKKDSRKSIYAIFDQRKKCKDHLIGVCEFDLNNNFFKDCTKTAIVSGSRESFINPDKQAIKEEEVLNVLDKTKKSL
jgi:hypothetical protein